MPKVKIDGVEMEVPAGITVLQACELAGVEIPRFCYHDRLSIAGNCRMCLVEVKPGPPKPQASCALPAAEGQEIFTDTPMVKKAREGVMEFLLVSLVGVGGGGVDCRRGTGAAVFLMVQTVECGSASSSHARISHTSVIGACLCFGAMHMQPIVA